MAFGALRALCPRTAGSWAWGDDPRVTACSLRAEMPHALPTASAPYNELRAEDISYDELGRPRYTVTLYGHPLCEVELAVSGEKNLLDALAAIAVVRHRRAAHEPRERNAGPLHRRAQAVRPDQRNRRRAPVLITDYASQSRRDQERPSRSPACRRISTLWCGLGPGSPHTYSRTKALFNGFVDDVRRARIGMLITDVMRRAGERPGRRHLGARCSSSRCARAAKGWT